jgi:hypothetical protein
MKPLSHLRCAIWRHVAVANVACIAALAGAGCAQPPDPRRTNFEIRGKDGVAKYNPKTGRLARLDIDHNQDGRIETFSYWDGARVLRIEIDADSDGRIDRWEHYDDANQLARVGSSRRDDGIEDTWTYPDERGDLASVATDINRDGAIDKREWFTTHPGSPGLRVLSTVDLDIDSRGAAGRRLHYSPDGTFQRVENLR